MYRSTLTSKGQLTLPKELRDRLQLKKGDQLTFELEGDTLRVKVARRLSVADVFARLRGSQVPYQGEAAEQAALGDYLTQKYRNLK